MEILGVTTTVLAIIGVVANNHRLRWCFAVWFVSNAISGIIHIEAGIWSLAARDLIFLVLAIDGWFRWGKKQKTNSTQGI